MEEVSSSILDSSTQPMSDTFLRVGFALGGFVAGEGCFSSTRRLPGFADGTERRRFNFSVDIATRDRPILEALRMFLGAGSITERPAGRAHWQPCSEFRVGSNRMHLRSTIPFADRFLLPCAKRDQYQRWRADLLAYLDAHPTRYGLGPSTCRIAGCPDPVRGRGLCRSHYYQETGH